MPGSLTGHLLGVGGFLLMLGGTLGYTWRKQPQRSGPGPVRYWLRAHVITGLVGPLLVLLHTGWAFRGLAGISFWLMVVVVISGIIGRVAYTASAGEGRRRLSAWWLAHVPLAAALFVLVLVHVIAALYYDTLAR